MKYFIYSTLFLLNYSIALCQNLSSGLRAHYTFDNILTDASGNSHHLTNDVGGISYQLVSGTDYSISFDGSSRLKQIDSYDNSLDTAGAISLWFKTNNPGSINQMLIQGSYIGFGLFLTPGTGYVNGFYSGSSSSAYSYPVNMLDNDWHHVVCQSNGSTIYLYVDGIFCGSTPHSFANGNGGSNNKIYFGLTNLLSANYTGSLNNCRIYDRMLTFCEIEELAGLTPQVNILTTVDTACESYFWNVNATEYFTSGFYSDTLQTTDGCDSILNLELTITNSLNVNIIQNGNTLEVNVPNASISWMDCQSNDILISDTTHFTPTTNGSYAAIVNQNGCIDTTLCVGIKTIGLLEDINHSFKVYPNPSSNDFYININGYYTIRIINSIGQTVFNETALYSNPTQLNLPESGFYTMYISNNNMIKAVKLIKTN